MICVWCQSVPLSQTMMDDFNPDEDWYDPYHAEPVRAESRVVESAGTDGSLKFSFCSMYLQEAAFQFSLLLRWNAELEDSCVLCAQRTRAGMAVAVGVGEPNGYWAASYPMLHELQSWVRLQNLITSINEVNQFLHSETNPLKTIVRSDVADVCLYKKSPVYWRRCRQ
jgi:hypothetical protein